MEVKSLLCPKCDEKNNPEFNKCWRCEASLRDARVVQTDETKEFLVRAMKRPKGIRFVIFMSMALACNTLLLFLLPTDAWWMIIFGAFYSVAFTAIAFDCEKLKDGGRIGAWFFTWPYVAHLFCAAFIVYDKSKWQGGLLCVIFLSEMFCVFLYALWSTLYLNRKTVRNIFCN